MDIPNGKLFYNLSLSQYSPNFSGFMGFGGIPDGAGKRIVIVFRKGINKSILTFAAFLLFQLVAKVALQT